MPGVGDQHTAAYAAVNPYEEVKPHVNEYTAQEIATLSSRLEKQLGPEYISTRPGASGQRVPYLAADKCINLANEVFGFNGWSSAIQQIQIDFVDESENTGKVSLGLSVIVRVTLRDGTYHEDIGYGHIENCKGKAPAFEKAKKEGTTDALKRALRNFGNILGNCVYDKDYVSKVTKIKVAPSRWDPDNLHRHPDYAPVKKEAAAQIKDEKLSEHEAMDSKTLPNHSAVEPEDEFAKAANDFDEVDFSVEHEISHEDSSFEQLCHANGRESTASRSNITRSLTRGDLSRPTNHEASNNNPQSLNGNRPANVDRHIQRPQCAAVLQQPFPQNDIAAPAQRHPSVPSGIAPQSASTGNRPKPQVAPQNLHPKGQESTPLGTPPSATSSTVTADPPVGFFTARVAETVQNASGLPLKVPSFNPHLESPSIRKTAGIDHSKTKPVGRDIVGAPQSPAAAAMGPAAAGAGRQNFVNPQTDKMRRVGMPVGAASPLANRGSYKPPTQMKRGFEGQPRPALGDVTAVTVNVPSHAGGEDAKRQRTGSSVPQRNGETNDR
ncbi:MAG: hypothetical protein LQ338_001672 [Usnochroma carphineum]|nr:MAG: hypothetical protein LQ338_001672 [Usnochroma carphineum]